MLKKEFENINDSEIILMIEVEVKAKIKSFDEMRKRLDDINAVKVKTEHQEDRYFNSPVRDFAQTDEALRIRTTRQNDEEHIFITYKGPKIDSKSKTRKEIEMGIEEAQKCSEIFELRFLHQRFASACHAVGKD